MDPNLAILRLPLYLQYSPIIDCWCLEDDHGKQCLLNNLANETAREICKSLLKDFLERS